MNIMTSTELRERWLNFFKTRGHLVIPSSPILPKDDDSLLWVNSGMAPLKPYFRGDETPPSTKIANSQLVMRTNDIENVGKTTRHHTLFEMLGNFSFGDYGRDEVLPWTLDFLVGELGIPQSRLYVTYHPGDQETRDKWLELGMTDSQLVPLDGNYWEIGPGPSGPCTEIFFYAGDDVNHDLHLLQEDVDNELFLEVWNVVFSEFEAVPGEERSNYPRLGQRNIDTGSGFERLLRIIQGVNNNFETDIFRPAVEMIMFAAGQADYEKACMVADHLRGLVVALSDGGTFSNKDRGYVLRRLLRRSLIEMHFMGIDLELVEDFAISVTMPLLGAYPHLTLGLNQLKSTLPSELKSFRRLIRLGEKHLIGRTEISGLELFKLKDTHGVPEEMLERLTTGANCDWIEYRRLLEEQRERSRKA